MVSASVVVKEVSGFDPLRTLRTGIFVVLSC